MQMRSRYAPSPELGVVCWTITMENAVINRRLTLTSATVPTALVLQLLLLLGDNRMAFVAYANAADWSRSEPISISLTNFAFTPQQVTLEHGSTYRFHFVNDSSSNHNFSAPELFDAVTIAPDDQSKVVDGSVDVPSRTSVDVKIVPNAPGSYEVRCTHLLHAMFGMTAAVAIK
jgi:plastocyanin